MFNSFFTLFPLSIVKSSRVLVTAIIFALSITSAHGHTVRLLSYSLDFSFSSMFYSLLPCYQFLMICHGDILSDSSGHFVTVCPPCCS